MAIKSSARLRKETSNRLSGANPIGGRSKGERYLSETLKSVLPRNSASFDNGRYSRILFKESSDDKDIQEHPYRQKSLLSSDSESLSRSLSPTTSTIIKHALSSGFLDLANHELRELSNVFYNNAQMIYWLQKSNSSNGQNIPNWWECQDITKLDISYNNMDRLPKNILSKNEYYSQTLSTIIGIGNNIAYLSNYLFKIKNIRIVNFNSNRIGHVSECLGSCCFLRELHLSNNQLTYLPASFWGGHGRESIILDDEEFDDDDGENTEDEKLLFTGQALTTLDVSSNKLSYIPANINEYLASLLYLNISHNRLTRLPDSMCYLRNLLNLDVSSNMLTELPVSLSGIPALKDNNACDDIIGMDKLVQFNASNNKLGSIPFQLYFPKLATIDLTNNSLKQIDENMFQHCSSKLSFISLRDNKLDAFISDDNIPKLANVSTIDISNNSFTDISNGFIYLQKLSKLIVEGNPIRCIRSTLLQRNNYKGLLAHLKNRCATNFDSITVNNNNGNPSYRWNHVEPADDDPKSREGTELRSTPSGQAATSGGNSRKERKYAQEGRSYGDTRQSADNGDETYGVCAKSYHYDTDSNKKAETCNNSNVGKLRLEGIGRNEYDNSPDKCTDGLQRLLMECRFAAVDEFSREYQKQLFFASATPNLPEFSNAPECRKLDSKSLHFYNSESTTASPACCDTLDNADNTTYRY